MKFLFLLLSILFISFTSLSQSMAEIFRILPDTLVMGMDHRQRDSLLRNGEYIFPGGDSDITEKSTVTLKDPDYFFYNFYYTTGQNAFATIELKRFKRNDGSNLVVYSKVAGMLRAYDQYDVLLFEYKNSKLIPIKGNLLPQNVPIKEFLKKGTPGSIAEKIENAVMATYDLDPEEPQSISYTLHPAVPIDDLEKYLLGDSMIFKWNGKTFTRKLSIWKDE